MPISGQLKTNAAQYAENYVHQNEVSTPSYYKLKLPQHQLLTEITANLRSGVMRITALKTDSVYVLVTPNNDQNKGFIHVDA